MFIVLVGSFFRLEGPLALGFRVGCGFGTGLTVAVGSVIFVILTKSGPGCNCNNHMNSLMQLKSHWSSIMTHFFVVVIVFQPISMNPMIWKAVIRIPGILMVTCV